MASKNAIEFLITARDATKSAFDKAGGGLRAIEKQVFSLQGALATLGVGAAVKASIDEFSKFETSLVDMGKVTKRPLEELRKEIMALPPELGDATSLMQGYYQVISAGVTEPKAALETLTASSKAAKAAHIEQAEVIKGLTKVMSGFEGQITSVSEASDLLFTIEKQGQTSVAELIPVIGGLAAVSSTMNVSANEMGAALARITQQAGSTAEAATRYDAILSSMMKPTKEMSELLDQYGGAQAAIQQLGFAGTMQLIQESTGGAAEALGDLFGRKEAIQGFLALASDGFAGFNTNMEEMEKKTGAADDAFKAWQKTFEATKQIFDSTIKKFAIEFGERIAPQVNAGLLGISNWLRENEALLLAGFDAIAAAVRGVGAAFKWLLELGQDIGIMFAKIFEWFEQYNAFVPTLGGGGFQYTPMGDLPGPTGAVTAGTAGGTNFNFYQALSRSDIDNIVTEQQRQAYRQ